MYDSCFPLSLSDTATRLGSMDDLTSLGSTKSVSPSPSKHNPPTKSVTWSLDSYESDNQISALRRQLKDVQQENISLLQELVNLRKDTNKMLESSVQEQRLHLARADYRTDETHPLSSEYTAAGSISLSLTGYNLCSVCLFAIVFCFLKA